MTSRLPTFVAALALCVFATTGARAQDRLPAVADVLTVDATVTTDVTPDVAVITLAVQREGTEVAPLTREVNEVLAKALADAKAVPGVIAANGGYSTFPRYDSRGNQNTRTGWQVRAELILKSRDFNALGALVGRLAQTLQISGTSFEISPELQIQTSSSLIEQAAKAFLEKATAGTRAFGYAGYSIRQVTLGDAGQSSRPRAMMLDGAMAKSATPMPMESGRVTLTVTVTGSVQMRK